MRRSDQRILTTHVGSLPRDPKLSDLLIRDEAGEKVDRAELARLGEQAVHHVVRQQMACGVDVINDGEQPRVGFQTYVPQRMKGFGGESKRPRSRDWTDFPGYAEFMAAAHAPPQQGDQRPAGGRRRGVRGSRAGQGRDPAVPGGAQGPRRAAGRDVHDRGGARHHRHHHAERALRQRTRPMSSRSPAR